MEDDTDMVRMYCKGSVGCQMQRLERYSNSIEIAQLSSATMIWSGISDERSDERNMNKERPMAKDIAELVHDLRVGRAIDGVYAIARRLGVAQKNENGTKDNRGGKEQREKVTALKQTAF